jgi:hypothetical protein
VPCYSPLRAGLVKGPTGPGRIVFKQCPGAKALSLPCGRCIGCRLERARQWAVRLVHESKTHEESCFVTLTYSDEFIPPLASLDVRDCQNFMKRLRERIAPKRIRFFLAGEYGENTQRPHYHGLIFGFRFPDLQVLKKGSEYTLYSSKSLDSTWGLGHCSVGNVTFDSAMYCANYTTKKIVGKGSFEFYGGRAPEFSLMSRRPGIGAGWFKKFRSDVYPSDEVMSRGVSTRPPRYYDKLLDEVDSSLLSKLKVKREVEADKLEEFVSGSGVRYCVAPSRNAVRLKVREVVARAKLALKSRSLGDVHA